jgi:uncharacterized protein YbgA (DUF1722 family)
MGLSEKNLETLVNMLNGLAQRQDTIRQLASHLRTAAVWRSVDGQLSVALSEAQRSELEEFIDAYLGESEVLIASVRAMLRQA